ncbi:MAG: hypothetical protein JNN30_09870 [Rhodanobacteraceae bacterium]|nr:hypothetical protein [Rhodanobacteraceae bacterium]
MFVRRLLLCAAAAATVVLCSPPTQGSMPNAATMTLPLHLLLPAAPEDDPPGLPGDLTALPMPSSPVSQGAIAGYLQGSASVSPTGQYGYTIPLDVPAGPAGWQPTLTLNYSSDAGNGPVGRGWSIAGSESRITRCGKTLSTDNLQSGVHFDAEDRFCLDGARLVVIAGTYGATGSEYRFENDSITKIVAGDASAQGPQRFDVWTKDGTHSEYTSETATRNTMTVNGIGKYEDVRLLWLLRRKTDGSGNVIEYDYHVNKLSDADNAIEILPRQISYSTANAGSRWRLVKFIYDGCDAVTCDRPDPIIVWQSGVRQETRKLLRSIELHAPRPSATSMVWRYLFTYEQGAITKNSRLTSVRKCGYMGACLLAKNFVWSDEIPKFTDRVIESDFKPKIAPLFAYVWYPKAAGRYPTRPQPSGQSEPPMVMNAGDMNNDGADDIIYSLGEGPERPNASSCCTNSPGHYFLRSVASPVAILPLNSKHLFNDYDHYESHAGSKFTDRNLVNSRIVDIDGDGIVELWAARQRVDSTVEEPRAGDFFHWDCDDPSTTGSCDPSLPGQLVIGTSSGSFDYTTNLQGDPTTLDFADLNGDARPDTSQIAALGAYSEFGPDFLWFTNLQDGSRLFGPQQLLTPDPTKRVCPMVAVDLDGDGRSELLTGDMGDLIGSGDRHPTCSSTVAGRVLRYDDSGSGVMTSFGDGRYPVPPISYADNGANLSGTINGQPIIPLTETWEQEKEELYFGDFNGDGLTDAAMVGWSGKPSQPYPHINIRTNSGNGFGPPQEFSRLPTWPHIWELRDKGLRIEDMDGDGRSDFVFFHVNSTSTPWGTNYAGITILHATGARIALPDRANQAQEYVSDLGQTNYGDWRLSKLGDFNGDGRPDIITYRGNGRTQNELVLIENEVDPVSTGYHNDSLTADQAEPGASDLLVEVWDQGTLWAREEIGYAKEWSARPRSDQGCGGLVHPVSFPRNCLHRGMAFVRKTRTRDHLLNPASDPMASDSTAYVREYSYEEPAIDMRGHGFLGFRRTRMWDPQRPMETIAYYDHELVDGKYYRYTRTPRSVRTAIPILLPAQVISGPKRIRGKSLPSDDRTDGTARVTSTLYEDEVVTFHSGRTYVVRPKKAITEEWEEDVLIDEHINFGDNGYGQHILSREGFDLKGYVGDDDTGLRRSEVTTTYYPDAYDNPKTVTTKIAGGSEGTIVYTYDNDTAAWRIGQQSSIKVKRWESGGLASAVTRTTGFHRDASGRIDQITIEEGSSNLDIPETITIGYLANGSEKSIKREAYDRDLARNVTREIRYDYTQRYPGAPDEQIFPSQIFMQHTPLNQRSSQWVAVHPAYGVAVAELDINGVRATASYDDLGRRLKLEVPGQPAVISTYSLRTDSFGGTNGNKVDTSQETSPGTGGVPVKQILSEITDARGLQIRSSQKGFDGTVTKVDTEYDLLGRRSRESRPYTGANPIDWTETRYDTLNRVYEELDAAGVVLRTHTHSFYEQRTTDAENKVSYIQRDKDGRVSKVGNVVAAGPDVTTRFTYSPFDLPRTITNDRGKVTTLEYDVRGRRTSISDPDRGITTTSYNGFGDVRRVEHAASATVLTHTFDDMGRVLTTTNPDGITRYTYDTSANGIGKLATTASPFQVNTTHRYDSYGRSTGADYVDAATSASYAITANFDPVYGRLDTLQYPEAYGRSRFTAKFKYTNWGALKEVGDASTGAPYKALWTVNARNSDLALTDGTLGNGVRLTPSYDPERGRLTGLLATGPAVGGGAAPTLLNLAYEYNADATLKRRNDVSNLRDERYHYDELGRLREWRLKWDSTTDIYTYRYDTLGNLTEWLKNAVSAETFGYGTPGGDLPHTLASRTAGGSSVSFVHDKLGRMTAGLGRAITYTAFDLPRTVSLGGNTWTLSYDAFGNRFKRAQGANSTVSIAGLYEKRVNSSAVHHVFHVPTGDSAQAQVTYREPSGAAPASAVVNYVITDKLDTVGLITKADGTVDQKRYFDPWGKIITREGATAATPAGPVTRGFTGQEHDFDVGLVNFRGRMYDALLRRFLSPDPVVSNPFFTQGWNPYSYVQNSPINITDPSGYQVSCPHSGGGMHVCTPMEITASVGSARNPYGMGGSGSGSAGSAYASGKTADMLAGERAARGIGPAPAGPSPFAPGGMSTTQAAQADEDHRSDATARAVPLPAAGVGQASVADALGWTADHLGKPAEYLAHRYENIHVDPSVVHKPFLGFLPSRRNSMFTAGAMMKVLGGVGKIVGGVQNDETLDLVGGTLDIIDGSGAMLDFWGGYAKLGKVGGAAGVASGMLDMYKGFTRAQEGIDKDNWIIRLDGISTYLKGASGAISAGAGLAGSHPIVAGSAFSFSFGMVAGETVAPWVFGSMDGDAHFENDCSPNCTVQFGGIVGYLLNN